MNILHLCTDFWPSTGGIEKFVLDLARYGRGAGLVPRILCFNRIHNSSQILPADDQVQGIPIRRVPFVNLRYYKAAWLPLRELRQADVLHVHGVGGILDFAAAGKWLHRRPIVLSTHGGIAHTSKLALLKRLYFGGLHRLAERFVDRAVACSRQDLELFRPVARRLSLIENGVDLAPFRPHGQQKAAGEGKTVPDTVCHRDRFLYVGRLSPNKQVDRLIRTFAQLRSLRPSASLRIVGPDWAGLLPSLQSLADSLGVGSAITFTGEVSDAQLVEEFGQAGVFASASAYEGFGISAVEAMAAGCIPILNDIPAFRHLLAGRENEANALVSAGFSPDDRDVPARAPAPQPGLLVDFSQPSSAATQIDQFLRSMPTGLIAAAGDRAEDFSWDRQIQLWKDLYAEVAGHTRSTALPSPT